MDTKEFIKRARKIHNDEYTYEHTEFVDWNTKVIVTCKIHGDFEISPRHHIYRKHGCKECRGRHISETKRYSQEDVIKMFKEIHGDEYIYDNVIYNGIDEDVEIICRKHGSFWQTPYNHIHKKCGCSKCRYEKLSEKFRLSIETLLKYFKEKHGDKYTYPHLEEEFENNRSEITIVCKEHGEFKQKVLKHLLGHGCQICNQSHLEQEISLFLDKHKIEYVRQQKFDWLKLNKPMSLDFYLPKYNVAIECQGEQHFEAIKHFGGDEEFELVLKRDKAKLNECNENGVKLLYYAKYENDEARDIYSNKNKLLEKILTYGT